MNTNNEIDEIIEILEKVLTDYKEDEEEIYKRVVKLKERRKQIKGDVL